ncbi:hypothetical protein CDL15_Pgr026719 [Punica granatum]|uniref:Uncharacterized protein n=1 Tax=Punica granatum TaxID=22663 RepID=A0A218WMP5_PUNGR|nr:hypothetical protein CDL15_Pgr026719 [Punica granatum]
MSDPSGSDVNRLFQPQLPPPPPSRRQLPFSSTKPPFARPGEYRRFAAEESSQQPDAIVVKTPVKRKNSALDKSAEFNEIPSVSGHVDLVNRALHPCIRKIDKDQQELSIQGWITNAQCKCSPSGNNQTPIGPCRYDSPLGLLTKKFVNLLKHTEGDMKHRVRARLMKALNVYRNSTAPAPSHAAPPAIATSPTRSPSPGPAPTLTSLKAAACSEAEVADARNHVSSVSRSDSIPKASSAQPEKPNPALSEEGAPAKETLDVKSFKAEG